MQWTDKRYQQHSTESKGDQQLVVASFFFYALGSDPRQKSLMGLYRTLLYQILTANPGLTHHLFPNQWIKVLSKPNFRSTYKILDEDIRLAYGRLSKHWDGDSQVASCFCFFIGALDEYQATISVDRREIVRALTDLKEVFIAMDDVVKHVAERECEATDWASLTASGKKDEAFLMVSR
jgi:hypothetical protein